MNIFYLGIAVCIIGILLGILMLKLSESPIALLLGIAVGIGGMIAVLKLGDDAIWKNGDVKILSQTTIASSAADANTKESIDVQRATTSLFD